MCVYRASINTYAASIITASINTYRAYINANMIGKLLSDYCLFKWF